MIILLLQNLNLNKMEDYLPTTKEDIEQNLINLRQLIFEVTPIWWSTRDRLWWDGTSCR